MNQPEPLRHAFHRELRRTTRSSGLLMGALALVLYPLWGFFDMVLEPELAPRFVALRGTVTVAMLGLYALLREHRWGRSHPAALVFGILLLVEVSIAWMIPQLRHALEAYLLGFSLALFAGGTLVTWRPRWTAALIGATLTALASFALAAPERLGAERIAVMAFYLLTASVVSLLASLHHHRVGWREFRSRAALQRERERAAFLAEASRVLGTSFDYATTLSKLARLAVPRLADFCVVDLLEPDNTFTRVSAAHVDPQKEALLVRAARARGEREHPLRELFRGRRSVLVREVSEADIEQFCVNGGYRWLVEALAPRSVMVVPLEVAGRLIGGITLGCAESKRCFDAEELEIAEALARRAALAVDNGRLFLQAQRAKEARDQTLAVVAHDLRNPLSVVLLGSELLLQAAPPAERPHLERVRRSAQRMNRLIGDLLDVKRIEKGGLAVELRVESAGRLVDEAAEMLAPLAAARRIRFETQRAEALPQIRGDANRLLQVISNLVGNAIKFTPEGGRVALRVEPREREVLFAVDDTGPGIAPEQIPHVFGRFWQVNQSDGRGIGLGLAIAKGIVDAHGGRIWVESHPGAGSTFVFALPRAEAWAESDPEPAGLRPATTGG